MRHWQWYVRFSFLVLVIGMVYASQTGFRQHDGSGLPLPFYDIRKEIPRGPEPQSQVRSLRATPRTAPRPGEAPVVIARDHLRRTLAPSQATDEDISNLRLVTEDRSHQSGITHLHFLQTYQGVDVFQCGASVHINDAGRVIAVDGRIAMNLSLSIDPTITVEDAVRRAAVAVGAPTRGDDQKSSMVIFPMPVGSPRLGWRVIIHKGPGEWYDVVLDAHSGEVLYRVNLYKFVDQRESALGLIFDPHPDAAPQVVRPFDGDPDASPHGWVRGQLSQGNNLIAREDVGGDDEIFPGHLARATNGRFEFPFRDAYAQTNPMIHDSAEFDLDRLTIRFTPLERGYKVQLLPLSFVRRLGSQLDIANNDFLEIGFQEGFAMPVYGTTYRSVFVNSNGSLTFGFGDADNEETAAKFDTQLPRIAPLWVGLNPDVGGGIFVDQREDRFVVTWNQVPSERELSLNAFQVTLFGSGIIEFSYNGVGSASGLVGVSPGGGFGTPESEVDFTQDAPFSVPETQPIVEQFPTDTSRVTEYFASLIDQPASITNMFYWANFMHDYLYALGFTEEAGNLQRDNFERGGMENDRLLADVHDGGFTDNAAMGTPPDGQSPRMALGLFTDPRRDSAVDADVLLHEYVHGLTERLIGGPANTSCLTGVQSGGLSEGWSDFYPASLMGDPVIGEYVMDDREQGIRRFAYDKSPLTYGDFGNRRGRFGDPIQGGIGEMFTPEVHDDGEIWASALWDLRETIGKSKAERLVTEALKLTPCRPSMLDARDAILLVNQEVENGTGQKEIWEVFAARGLGASAGPAYRVSDPNADDVTSVFEAFDVPESIGGTQPSDGEIIFREDFEQGLKKRWTIEGEDGVGGAALWNRSRRKAAEGTKSVYYGRDDEATYDTGARNFGALTSPVIDLTGRTGAVLEFEHILKAERLFPFDPAVIRVSTDGGETFEQVAFLFNNTIGERFHKARLNLSKFLDRQIRIQFYFDTLDDQANAFEGWYLDNIVVKEWR